jgi:hypothetical protein
MRPLDLPAVLVVEVLLATILEEEEELVTKAGMEALEALALEDQVAKVLVEEAVDTLMLEIILELTLLVMEGTVPLSLD